jgi:hypothetical protein
MVRKALKLIGLVALCNFSWLAYHAYQESKPAVTAEGLRYSRDTSSAIKTVPWKGDYTHDAPRPLVGLFDPKTMCAPTQEPLSGKFGCGPKCQPGYEHPMVSGSALGIRDYRDPWQCKAIARAK